MSSSYELQQYTALTSHAFVIRIWTQLSFQFQTWEASRIYGCLSDYFYYISTLRVHLKYTYPENTRTSPSSIYKFYVETKCKTWVGRVYLLLNIYQYNFTPQLAWLLISFLLFIHLLILLRSQNAEYVGSCSSSLTTQIKNNRVPWCLERLIPTQCLVIPRTDPSNDFF